MRVLFFSNEFPSPGRPRRASFNLAMCQALMATNEVQVVSPIGWREKPSRPTTKLQSASAGQMGGIPVVYPRFYYTPLVNRGLYHHFMWHSVRRALMERMAEFRPDVVLSYWAHPDGAVATKAARLAGVPSVVMVGGSDVLILGQGGRRRRCIVESLSRADAVVAVSEDLKNNVVAMGIDERRVHVVYRGVDRERFHPGERAAARAKLAVRPDASLLLWVGRMEAVKGLDVLLAACNLLKQRQVDFQLVLIGDGSLRGKLEASCRALDLSGQVTFQGPVAHGDLADWYRAANVMVLPSYSEGIPNALLESISCGTPFVASQVGGIPEIANPALDRLVPPGDPEALAQAVQASLTDSGRNSPRSFQPWSLRESAERLEAVFADLLPTSRYASTQGVAW